MGMSGAAVKVRMVEEDLAEKLRFSRDLEEMREGAMWNLRKSIPGRGNNKCKGPLGSS